VRERHSLPVEHREGHIRTAIESLRAMGTYQLPRAERTPCQDSQRKQASKDTHVLSNAEGGARQSGQQNKSETRGAHILSSGACQDSEKCQRIMGTHQLSNAEGRLVRTAVKSYQAGGTHFLSAEAEREKLVRIENESQ
jgi:hypothetical protein